jgi:hypothetical protein
VFHQYPQRPWIGSGGKFSVATATELTVRQGISGRQVRRLPGGLADKFACCNAAVVVR